MHILDCYSLNCGLKIKEPFLMEKFFPLDVDKYITIDNFAQFPSREYDYWADVVRGLSAILSQNGISILQVGNCDSPLANTYDLRGQASIAQSAYIIKGSMLHLTVDGFSQHLANKYGVNLVCLYSDSPPENSGPFDHNADKCKLLKPELEVNNYSYSAEEDPKTINSIKPEDVINSVCELLDLGNSYAFKTKTIGTDYNAKSVEFVPKGNAIDTASLSIDSLIVRMDLAFDEQVLHQQLLHSKCSIITDKPINLNLLKTFRSRISQFVYLVGDNDSKQYVESIFSSGIQCLLMSEKSGEELEALKFKYLDFGKIHDRSPKKKPEDLEDTKNLFYRSNKYIIYEGRVYYSVAGIRAQNPVDMVGSDMFQKVIDHEDFWRDRENFYIVEKN